MTMTILTTLGALIAALTTAALMVPVRQTAAARALSRPDRLGRAVRTTRSFGPGR